MIRFPAARRWLIGLLALVFAIVCHSFVLTPLKTPATPGNQLVLSSLQNPTTFNYALNEVSPNVFDFMYEGLVSQNGVTGKIEPDLAQQWEISANGHDIVFTLREALKWSDGQPLTADDVVFTYNNIYFNEQIPTSIRDSFKIGKDRVLPKVTKLDEKRIQFSLPETFSPFLRNTSVAILPAHVLREFVSSKTSSDELPFLSIWGTETNPAKIIVNGPYQIERYTPDRRVEFRRNPYYWRKDERGNSQPYIDRVTLELLASPEEQLSKFRAGELDSLEIVRPEDFEALQPEQKLGNFTLYNGGVKPGWTYLAFNLNKGRRLDGSSVVDPIQSRWFNTVAFRQAVAYAIDRPTMLSKIFKGLGELQNSSIPVQSQYYRSPAQGLKVYNYNPEQAKTLLLKAGFKYNAAGQLLDAEGNRVRFTLITNQTNHNPTREVMAAQIQQDLSKIGIQVDVQTVGFNELIDRILNTLDWQAHLSGFTGGVEPNEQASIWLPEGGLHLFNYNPPSGEPQIAGREVADWELEISRLYLEGAQELDEAKRRAIYGEVQRLAQEYVPIIYLVNQFSLAAVRDRIQNVKYSALGGVFWNIYELKVKEN
ncbi:MAG TPA: ABC transporter substrate-binding protein [Allocoleopsis sp.]